MLILAKWNSGVEQWSPGGPKSPEFSVLEPRNPAMGRSPGDLNPFGILSFKSFISVYILACVFPQEIFTFNKKIRIWELEKLRLNLI